MTILLRLVTIRPQYVENYHYEIYVIHQTALHYIDGKQHVPRENRTQGTQIAHRAPIEDNALFNHEQSGLLVHDRRFDGTGIKC